MLLLWLLKRRFAALLSISSNCRNNWWFFPHYFILMSFHNTIAIFDNIFDKFDNIFDNCWFCVGKKCSHLSNCDVLILKMNSIISVQYTARNIGPCWFSTRKKNSNLAWDRKIDMETLTFSVLMFLLLLISHLSSSEANIQSETFAKSSYSTTASSFLKTWTTRSKLHCSKECAANPYCYSWMYDKTDKTCSLQASRSSYSLFTE